MKKTAIGFAALALVAMATAPAFATVLMSEGFAYSNGNLVPNGGWATHSGTGTDVQVSAGRAVGNMANAPDDNRTITAQSATAKTYYCMEVMIPTPAAAVVTNYFAHLKDTGTSNFAGRLGIVAGTTSGFRFALGSTAFTTPVSWGSDLAFNTSYRVVVSYNAATGGAEMWINPANELSTKVTQAGGTTGFLISAFAFRQSSTGGTAWGFSADNLGVGSSFDDACFQITPTRPSTWGQVKSHYR